MGFITFFTSCKVWSSRLRVYETITAHPHAYRMSPETRWRTRNNIRAPLPRGNIYKNIRRTSHADSQPKSQVNRRRSPGHNTLWRMSPFGNRRSLLAFATCLSPAFVLATPLAAPGLSAEGLSRRGNGAKIPCGNAPNIIAGKWVTKHPIHLNISSVFFREIVADPRTFALPIAPSPPPI